MYIWEETDQIYMFPFGLSRQNQLTKPCVFKNDWLLKIDLKHDGLFYITRDHERIQKKGGGRKRKLGFLHSSHLPIR